MYTQTNNHLTSSEHQKSFDVLSSVYQMRFDIQAYGQVLPETETRIYEEELSLLAEGLDKPLYTEFHIRRIDGQLAYFNNGQWSSYLGSLQNSLGVYKQESAADFRRAFMVDRAQQDLEQGYKLNALKPGEHLRWGVDYPEEAQRLYGDEFMGSLGFWPQRRTAFFYEAEADEQGEVTLKTWSVDNYDAEAFRAGLSGGDMRRAYDAAMANKYGGDWYAGRPADSFGREENSWDLVRGQKDLVSFFLEQIKGLATSNMSIAELETAKKDLTYGVWGALKNRIDNPRVAGVQASNNSFSYLQNEVQTAFKAASERFETMYACGGSIGGERAIYSANSRDVYRSIFGEEGSDKTWISCPYCKTRKFCDPCAAEIECGGCEAKVSGGKLVVEPDQQKLAKIRIKRLGFFSLLEREFAALKG